MLRQNRRTAERFLERLGGNRRRFTFQTFGDKNRTSALTFLCHGGLDRWWSKLKSLNNAGAGVFVTVQPTDGKGRKRENIIGARALFQEDDGNAKKLPLKPHIVVETSPGKFHRYLLLSDCPSASAWETIQRRIVRDYGSDPSAKDITRVLRVPGFFHNKKTPFMSRLVRISRAEAYSWETIKKHFLPILVPKKVNGSNYIYEPARIYSALCNIDADVDYDQWCQILMAIHAADPSPKGLDLAVEWSMRGKKYKEGEIEDKWSTFNRDRSNKIEINSLFFHAWDNGWDGEYILDNRGRELLKLEQKLNPKIEIVCDVEETRFESIGGLVGDLIKWSARRAYITQPIFDLGVALLATAMLSGNRYRIAGWNTPLQPFLLFAVSQGGGKDHMRRCLSDILQDVGLNNALASGYQSIHALFDQLGEPPHVVCWILDELAEYLRNGMRPGSTDRVIISQVLSLYGLGSGRFEGFHGRRQTIEPIENPFLCIGASTQPDPLKAVTGLDYVSNGLLSRFILLRGAPLRRNRNRIENPALPKGVRMFQGVESGRVKFNADIAKKIEDFADECLELSFKGGAYGVWTRANQNALMIAGLIAIGYDVRKPEITNKTWDIAKKLARQSCEAWVDSIGDADTDESRIRERVRELLTHPARAKSYMDTTSEFEAFTDGWISRRSIMRAMSGRVRKRIFDDAIQWLLEDGSIEAGRYGKTIVYRG